MYRWYTAQITLWLFLSYGKNPKFGVLKSNWTTEFFLLYGVYVYTCSLYMSLLFLTAPVVKNLNSNEKTRNTICLISDSRLGARLRLAHVSRHIHTLDLAGEKYYRPRSKNISMNEWKCFILKTMKAMGSQAKFVPWHSGPGKQHDLTMC